MDRFCLPGQSSWAFGCFKSIVGCHGVLRLPPSGQVWRLSTGPRWRMVSWHLGLRPSLSGHAMLMVRMVQSEGFQLISACVWTLSELGLAPEKLHLSGHLPSRRLLVALGGLRGGHRREPGRCGEGAAAIQAAAPPLGLHRGPQGAAYGSSQRPSGA